MEGEEKIEHRDVEIERKFVFTADTEKTILEAGGRCVSEESFTDSYYDTVDFKLTLASYWLRYRSGKWELKAPLRSISEETEIFTKYLEVTDEDAIQGHLSAVLSSVKTNSDLSSNVETESLHGHTAESQTKSVEGIPKWLSELAPLTVFAEYTTRRRSFVLDGGVSVVLDETDFGFQVGEIEVMTGESDGEEAGARQEIERVAQILGLQAQPVAPGKMSAFLRRFAPEHFKTLLAAGILQK